MKRFAKKSALLTITVLSIAGIAKADSTTYSIQDVGTFGNYTDSNTSDTFSGTGFVGIYANEQPDSFAHLFGLENYAGVYSETEMQVNIAALAGENVTSATLSYTLQNGSSGTQTATVTSFTDSNGLLSYNATPSSDLGDVTFTSNGLSTNTVDVTTLVQNAVNSNSTWLGLYLTPNGPLAYQWTYTTGDANSADVTLTVNTAAAATPLPKPAWAGGAMMGALILGGLARRRKHAAL